MIQFQCVFDFVYVGLEGIVIQVCVVCVELVGIDIDCGICEEVVSDVVWVSKSIVFVVIKYDLVIGCDFLEYNFGNFGLGIQCGVCQCLVCCGQSCDVYGQCVVSCNVLLSVILIVLVEIVGNFVICLFV